MSAGAAPMESRLAAARNRARVAKQTVAIGAAVAFAALVLVARHSHPGGTSTSADDGTATATAGLDATQSSDDGWSGWGSSIGPSQSTPQVGTRSS